MADQGHPQRAASARGRVAVAAIAAYEARTATQVRHAAERAVPPPSWRQEGTRWISTSSTGQRVAAATARASLAAIAVHETQTASQVYHDAQRVKLPPSRQRRLDEAQTGVQPAAAPHHLHDDPHSLHTCGDRVPCRHCGTFKWLYESPALCCMKGTGILPPAHNPPIAAEYRALLEQPGVAH